MFPQFGKTKSTPHEKKKHLAQKWTQFKETSNRFFEESSGSDNSVEENKI